MSGFAVFQVIRDGVIVQQAFSHSQIRSVTLNSAGPNTLRVKGQRLPITIVDEPQSISQAIGIWKPRTLVCLTPKSPRNGNGILVTPENIGFIMYKDDGTHIYLPDGSEIPVKEGKDVLEPILNEHQIYIRQVKEYQGSKPHSTEVLIF